MTLVQDLFFFFFWKQFQGLAWLCSRIYSTTMQNAWVPFQLEMRFLFLTSIQIFRSLTTAPDFLHQGLLNTIMLMFREFLLTVHGVIYTVNHLWFIRALYGPYFEGVCHAGPRETVSWHMRQAWHTTLFMSQPVNCVCQTLISSYANFGVYQVPETDRRVPRCRQLDR